MKIIPKTGELYQDVTGKIYQAITVAAYVDTGEQIVVYQEMSGEFGIYARPLQQFIGENGQQRLFKKIERANHQLTDEDRGGGQASESRQQSITNSETKPEHVWKMEQQIYARKPEQQQVHAAKTEFRPRTQSPAESKRALRQNIAETSGEGAFYSEKRRRQMEEREQRREMFRKSERHASAAEELRANPCLMKFLETDTYEEKFHVLNEIQNDITDRLIDDIAVVLDVVIPEGALNDRFQQLRNIILTRQKYETNRFR